MDAPAPARPGMTPLRRAVAVAALASFLVACCLPAIEHPPPGPTHGPQPFAGPGPPSRLLGVQCLVSVFGFLHVAWWANVAALAGAVCLWLGLARGGVVCAGYAALLGATMLGRWLPDPFGGYWNGPWDLLAGFWWWWGSHWLLLALAVTATRDGPESASRRAARWVVGGGLAAAGVVVACGIGGEAIRWVADGFAVSHRSPVVVSGLLLAAALGAGGVALLPPRRSEPPGR